MNDIEKTIDPRVSAPSSTMMVGAPRLVVTIQHHPDLERVGDRFDIPLFEPVAAITISRNAPAFAPPDAPAKAQPLNSAAISRQPFSLTISPYDEGVLSFRKGSMELRVGDETLAGTRHLEAAALDRGISIVVNRSIALLVQRTLHEHCDPSDAHGMVGASGPIELLRARVDTAAPNRAPVLIRGETGSGKELVARALHDASPRRGGPFVAVNLAAVTSSLAASELFGHVRGAFSGARADRDGYFVQAHGGTLFLDELGECKPDIQAILLRALESGEIQPVGSSRTRTVDVRLIAATDADLGAMVEAGTFRAPLYYRFASHELHVPPLRERKDDIARLIIHFLREELAATDSLAKLTARIGDRPWFPASVMASLCDYSWPGNVRQLRNVARYLASAPGPLSVRDPQLAILLHEQAPAADASKPVPRQTPAPAPPPAAKQSSPAPTDEELEALLDRVSYRLSVAARELGVSRPTLAGMIDRHPRLKRAQALTREEIEQAQREHGDGPGLWRRLRVSAHGLKLRMRELGLT